MRSAFSCLVAPVMVLAGLFLQLSAAIGDTSNGPSPTDFARTVDHQLRLEVAEISGSTPIAWAERTDDVTFLRRVYLDLVGTPPPPAIIKAFAADDNPNKRRDMIDHLLDDRRYGENWASYWRDVIMYRRSEDRALLSVPALDEYLTTAFNANTPWNDIAKSFVEANGNIRENGATGIYSAQLGRPEESAAEFSRVFMGIQIQCAQCHDHPYDAWKREQFHELAAFLPRITLRPIRDEDGPRSFELVGVDRLPNKRRKEADNNRYRPKPEHYMSDLEDPSAEGTLMQPVFFVSGQKLQLGLSDQERRSQLADWMTAPSNPWFAKAIVNRLWTELVGTGFYDHIDDLGPERPCQCPKTLDLLAQGFIDHRYDVKWLFRVICSTETYQQASRSVDPEEAVPFTHNVPQRLRANAVFSSLKQAVWWDDAIDVRRPRGRRAALPTGDEMAQANNAGGRRIPERLFEQQFGYDPSAPRDEISSTIPQSLTLMNSPIVARMIDTRRPRGLTQLLESTSDDAKVIEQLYLRCLSRDPSDDERRDAMEHLRGAASREDGCEDILWALVNCSEFLYRP